MFALVRRSLLNSSKPLHPLYKNVIANVHSVFANGVKRTITDPFLSSTVPTLIPSCGMKVVGKPRKRCEDCYFVRRQNRLHVMCKTHGRHKQMSMVKDPRNTWILTHATMSKKRPW
ncbi:hypothetical protein ABEB36_007722 [Hypothenemus hampei]|uniref:Ribosomal protein n=1 Tax=Hypothenemus hampei TaxID=57062 RepID=A0ABD1EVZ6_HYPHA